MVMRMTGCISCIRLWVLMLLACTAGHVHATTGSPDFEVQKSDGGAPGAPAQIVSTVLKGAGEQPGAPPSGASPSPN
eukprot:COSAG02_NODE_41050_length_398_cov_1.769231_1_plen_76_part_10